MPLHINTSVRDRNRTIHQNQDKDLTQSATSITNQMKDVKNAAAQKISTFLRKVVAAQSYGLMFANGSVFEKTGDALPKKGEHEAYGFSSLQKLDDTSKNNLSAIRNRLGALTGDEISLKEKITAAKWDFRHQSNAVLDDGKTLNIASNHMLSHSNVPFRSKTFAEDKELLSNHDFVFFGVEYSGIGNKDRPLNSKFQGVDFGNNAYVVSEDLPSLRHGYLTLTDHLDTTLPSINHPENPKFFQKFPIAMSELSRPIHNGGGMGDAPIFSFYDMKEAVALNLIEFLRNSGDDKFREYVLTQAMNSGHEMDRVLNSVFQAEFHVPRILSSQDYVKHMNRDIFLEKAVETTNFSELDERVSDRDKAVSAMIHAIECENGKVAGYLLEKWTFSQQDFADLPIYKIHSALSTGDRSGKVLDKFISLNLIDLNAKFEGGSVGGLFLNAAINNRNGEILSVLARHGAKLECAQPIEGRLAINTGLFDVLSMFFPKDEAIKYIKINFDEHKEFYANYMPDKFKSLSEFLQNHGALESTNAIERLEALGEERIGQMPGMVQSMASFAKPTGGEILATESQENGSFILTSPMP
ncbi:T3SS effector OspC family protein [Burkholderia pyrrocinia]